MKLILAALVAVTSLPVTAIPLDQALELCRAEQNALRRLTCYDSIQVVTAGNSSANAAVMSAKTVSTPTTHTNAEKRSGSDFGIEHRKVEEEIQEKVYMSVKNVRYNPHKELIIEFDNGQTWRQNGTEQYKISAGEQHYIKRGVLNSFFLGNDKNNRTIRVRREQ